MWVCVTSKELLNFSTIGVIIRPRRVAENIEGVAVHEAPDPACHIGGVTTMSAHISRCCCLSLPAKCCSLAHSDTITSGQK